MGASRYAQVQQDEHAIEMAEGANAMDQSDDIDEAGEAHSLILVSGANGSAEERLNRYIMPEDRFSAFKRPVRRFYTNQNEFLESLKKLVSVTAEDDEEEKPSTAAYLAIQISLALTFVLLAMKLFAAVASGSIAIIASSVDSMLDVLSQGTLLLTSRLMLSWDPIRYPRGKNRMEPVAVLIFSCLMGMCALFLLYTSIMDLNEGITNGGRQIQLDALSTTLLSLVIVVQFIMYLYCRRVAAMPIPGASSADALAQDHFNDVMINIMSLFPALIASNVPNAWYADPIGCICLSLYIAVRWTISAYEQMPAMIGESAPPEFLNQLNYLAGTHDPRILKIDTVLAYHVGPRYQCEVHIVLPSDMSLKDGHDIGEELEKKIERLNDVEMAFVHLDYEWQHRLEHTGRKAANGREVKDVASPRSKQVEQSDDSDLSSDEEDDSGEFHVASPASMVR